MGANMPATKHAANTITAFPRSKDRRQIRLLQTITAAKPAPTLKDIQKTSRVLGCAGLMSARYTMRNDKRNAASPTPILRGVAITRLLYLPVRVASTFQKTKHPAHSFE